MVAAFSFVSPRTRRRIRAMIPAASEPAMSKKYFMVLISVDFSLLRFDYILHVKDGN